ncbi:type II toxin-antitoxin system HigB family toxin [Photorhabdus caribbeanensis]|uniref:type II toxin-antitoxin system HigB family toxin n=1 Tax=Photorhabdus caribbeanensis TaxID=1004165 RepID=UPI001FECED39
MSECSQQRSNLKDDEYIDIGGNNVRLLAFIKFSMEHHYIKHIVSHAEYDKLTNDYRRNRE